MKDGPPESVLSPMLQTGNVLEVRKPAFLLQPPDSTFSVTPAPRHVSRDFLGESDFLGPAMSVLTALLADREPRDSHEWHEAKFVAFVSLYYNGSYGACAWRGPL